MVTNTITHKIGQSSQEFKANTLDKVKKYSDSLGDLINP